MPPEPRTYQPHTPTQPAQVCPDCSTLVADTRQHDRWHQVLAELGHVPVVRAGGNIHRADHR